MDVELSHHFSEMQKYCSYMDNRVTAVQFSSVSAI